MSGRGVVLSMGAAGMQGGLARSRRLAGEGENVRTPAAVGLLLPHGRRCCCHARLRFSRPPSPWPPRRPCRSAPRSQKLDGPYDSRVLPVVLTCVMMTFLTVVWIGSIVSYVEGGGK